MSENPPNNDNLVDALHKLGENLIQTLQAAWDSPERKKVQNEIETGLDDITQSVKKNIENFGESPTGQQLKTDLNELRDRVRSGETEAQLRQEILKALQIVNDELEKAASRLRNADKPDSPSNESDGKEA